MRQKEGERTDGKETKTERHRWKKTERERRMRVGVMGSRGKDQREESFRKELGTDTQGWGPSCTELLALGQSPGPPGL